MAIEVRAVLVDRHHVRPTTAAPGLGRLPPSDSDGVRGDAPLAIALFAGRVEPIRFSGTIRYWKPERASGLAVVDIPDAHVQALGGLKQQRVRGSIAAAQFASNVMPSGAGGSP